MRVCNSAFPRSQALRLSVLAALASGILAGCSSSGIDRLTGGHSSESTYTASVDPVDSGAVQSEPLDGNQSGGFKARPVVAGGNNYGSLPAPQPVDEPAEQTAYAAPAPAPAPQPAPVAAPKQIASAAGVNHKVKPGETMYSLGRTYQVKPAAIADANNLDHNATLKVGQTVRIPGAAAVASAMPDAAPAATDAPAPQPAPKQVASRTDPAETVTDESPADTPAPAVASSDQPSFRWPVQGRVISGFGSKPGGLRNEGINISVPEGTPVRAAESGVVAYAGNELKGYGNLVLIRHDNGFVTAYAHNKELIVKRGDAVKRGDIIAKAGQTGSVESPQVHFEVRKGPTALDPIKYLGSAAASGN